ncbi:hypothetical protein NDI52_31185 [Leptolyngbya sp. PL-A3]|uniref:hypothetical protein n=1 Tax=Leptolyngbya sp. PL-A3 TaxID=2933911 RepID=UPI003296935D
MALAILQWQDADAAYNRFQVDIGCNRYYSYAIGNGMKQRVNGLQLLDDPHFVSPVVGPLAENSLGRTVLEIPNKQIDCQHRFIQITSFRTPDRTGPAISEIVEIPLNSALTTIEPRTAAAFSLEQPMSNSSVETVPFIYKEVRPMETAEALGFLSSIIKTVLPAATKAATQVLSNGGQQLLADSAKQAAQVAKQVLTDTAKQTLTEVAKQNLPAEVANPETLKLLETLLQQASNVSASQKAATTSASNGTSSALAIASRSRTGSALSMAKSTIGSSRGSVATALSYSPNGLKPSAYTEQLAVPAALLSQLPALMPLLQQVLTPETVKAVIDSPAKLLSTVTDGIQKLAQADLEANKQEQQHLEKLMANAGDAAAEKWAYGAALTNAFSTATVATPYQHVSTVRLMFADVVTVMLNGRSRPIYHQNQDITFPLTVETPRPIRDGVVQLLVKHPETLEILIEQKVRVGAVMSGPLAVAPTLSREQLRALSPNQEYLVCAVLLWSGRDKATKKQKRLGTSMTQLITLVGDYCFDRMEGTAEVVPLNDVDRFRDYWHKVWEKQFSDPEQQISLDCKYYLTLESDRTNHARMETLTKFGGNGSTHQTGKLKTGLLMSPQRLNELLPQISSHPSLSEGELKALLSPEFKQQCSYAARNQVEFEGRKGDTVALWAYPEMKLQRVLLKQAGQTNTNGQVLALTEHEVYFPMPAIVHFVGACT